MACTAWDTTPSLPATSNRSPPVASNAAVSTSVPSGVPVKSRSNVTVEAPATCTKLATPSPVGVAPPDVMEKSISLLILSTFTKGSRKTPSENVIVPVELSEAIVSRSMVGRVASLGSVSDATEPVLPATSLSVTSIVILSSSRVLMSIPDMVSVVDVKGPKSVPVMAAVPTLVSSII